MRSRTPLLISIAWLVTGAIGGSVCTSLLLDGDDDTAALADPPSPGGAATAVALDRDVATSRFADSVAARVDAYRATQQESDLVALSQALESAADQAPSPERDLEVDAVLGRIAELAPAYAASLAIGVGLDQPFVERAYILWAEADPEAALAGLARIASPSMRRDVALALTAVLGDDARSIARIGASLSRVDNDALFIAWLAQWASRDPFGAFREAVNLGEVPSRLTAVHAVAVAWAADDPYGALSQSDQLPEGLARSFRASVLAEWARFDAEGLAFYLETHPNLEADPTSVIRYLRATHPDLVERVSGSARGDAGPSLQSAAMQALASRDPARAKAEAEAFPPGQERDRAVRAVAGILARSDPTEALHWLRGLSPLSPDIVRSVMVGIAQGDASTVLALLDDPLVGGDSVLALAIATAAGASDPAQMPSIAEHFRTQGNLQSQGTLGSFVRNWVQRDPVAALDWVLEQGTQIDRNVIESAAQTLAMRDPVAAAGYTDRIPPAQRGAWITQVATRYGRYDPQAAMNWVMRYQGQEYYDVAVREVIVNAARADPDAASRLLLPASPTVQREAAQQVALALAEQDPRAAAAWAQSVIDPRARSSAQFSVAGTWYSSDPEGARRYVLAQPEGVERDLVLSNLVQIAASSGSVDQALMDGFSSDVMRQQAMSIATAAQARFKP